MLKCKNAKNAFNILINAIYNVQIILFRMNNYKFANY